MGVVVSLRPAGVEPRRTPETGVALEPQVRRSARPGQADAVRRPEAPLRLTARGRVVVVLLALLLVALPLVLGARAAQAEPPASVPQVEQHVVAPGETLWRIAATIAAPGDDIRDVVDGLVRLNALPDSSLLAGQTVLVPVSD